MRLRYAITSLLLLFAASLEGQVQTTVVVANEAILNTYSVSLRGLPVISTNGSTATDCTFGSGTGLYLVHCFYCDGTDAWVADGVSCAAPSDSYLLMETGDYVLLETGDKIILE